MTTTALLRCHLRKMLASFCRFEKWNLKSLSRVWLFAIPWTTQSMVFSRPEYWSGFPFSRGSSQLRDQTHISRTAGRFFTSWAVRKAWGYWGGQPIPCPAHLLNPGIEQGSPALQGILYQLSYQGSPSVGLILITDRVMLFNISLLSGLLFVLHMKLVLSLKNKSVQMTSPLRTLPSLLKTLAKQF